MDFLFLDDLLVLPSQFLLLLCHLFYVFLALLQLLDFFLQLLHLSSTFLVDLLFAADFALQSVFLKGELLALQLQGLVVLNDIQSLVQFLLEDLVVLLLLCIGYPEFVSLLLVLLHLALQVVQQHSVVR